MQTETTLLQKNVCVAIKSRQQKALTIKKLQNCKCDECCRFADRTLEAQIAQRDSIFANKSTQQKAPDIKKLQNCKCDKLCRFAGRLHVQIPHVLPTISQNSDGRLKRKSGEKTSLRAISAQTTAQ